MNHRSEASYCRKHKIFINCYSIDNDGDKEKNDKNDSVYLVFVDVMSALLTDESETESGF